MAGAKRSEAELEAQTFGAASKMLDVAATLIGKYHNIKEAQKERMFEAKLRMDSYQNDVNSGKTEFNPRDYAVLKNGFDSAKATYDSWWVGKVTAGVPNENEATGEFLKGASETVKLSIMKRL
jgi:hypothetical protein